MLIRGNSPAGKQNLTKGERKMGKRKSWRKPKQITRKRRHAITGKKIQKRKRRTSAPLVEPTKTPNQLGTSEKKTWSAIVRNCEK